MNYVTYLYQKDDTEFNGLESYVFAQLQEQALDWIPNRTSLVIQEQRIKEKLVYQEDDGEEQDATEAKEELLSKLAALLGVGKN